MSPPRAGRFPLARRALALVLPAAIALPALAGDESWEVLRPRTWETEGGATLELLADGSLRASGGGGEREAYTLHFELAADELTGLRLEARSDPALPSGGPGCAANGNFALSELRVLDVSRAGMRGLALGIPAASADWAQQGWPITAAFDGDERTGWAIHPELGRDHVAVLTLERAIRGDGELRFDVEMVFAYGQAHSLGRFRLLGTSAPGPHRLDDGTSWEGMQDRIDRAIDAGIDYLIDSQELDGAWSYEQGAYPNGQTALAVYTLLKQQVPPGHPAVQRALEYLRAEPPAQTYAMGCQLLALAALDDPLVKPWIEELVHELLDWQITGLSHLDGAGGFGYPDRAVDISNTQYGALGLWAASTAGVEIPKKAWLELARHVLAHQARSDDGSSPAGFAYHPGGPASGSRSAAGVGILALCEAMLGAEELRGLPIEEAKARGLAWLAKHFTVKEDPGEPSNTWLYYYLYALERMGGFTGLQFIGASDWYREGARFLVETQEPDGSWSKGRHEEQANTCFAILFLSRATAPSTGHSAPRVETGVRRLVAKLYGRDDPTKDVSLRASGDSPMTAWIAGFGAELTETWAWPEGRGGGLRARTAQFLEAVEPRAGEWWTRAPPWRFTPRPPGKGWTEPGFAAGAWTEGRGAFGDPATGGSIVNTEWLAGDLWLVRRFEIAPDQLVEPAIWVLHADAAARAGLVVSAGPLVCLFDEEREFPARLGGAHGTSLASIEPADAVSGAIALRVTAEQRFEAQVPGWGFALREHPREGEYRHLRFAWKSLAGRGVMLQLADAGGWGGRTMRYYAGENLMRAEPALRIAPELPREWEVVTRDLWRDCGGDAVISGIAFAPMDGEALFDGVWLARNRADLPELHGGPDDQARMVEAGATRESSNLSVWLNGSPAWRGEIVSGRHVPLVLERPLGELLLPGENLIAVQVRSLGLGDLFDLELRDRPLLASVALDPEVPVGDQRLRARLSFASPGKYSIRARVGLALDGLDGGAGLTEWVESEPLEVEVEEAFHPELLVYAGDRARDLLHTTGVQVSASSESAGWPAQQACDRSQARGWLCAQGDAAPALSIVLASPVRADRIQLSAIRATKLPAGTMGRAGRAEILVNKKLRHELELDPDEWRKSCLVLDRPQSIRQLEIRLVRDPSAPPTVQDAVGLAEVELVLAQ